jgi:hypothetical protein
MGLLINLDPGLAQVKEFAMLSIFTAAVNLSVVEAAQVANMYVVDVRVLTMDTALARRSLD